MSKKYILSIFFGALFFASACTTNPLLEGLEPPPSSPLIPKRSNASDSSIEDAGAQVIDRSELTCQDEELHCIGVVINSGLFEDKSFNQSTWEGAKRAEGDLAAYVEYIEAETSFSSDEHIGHFVERGFDVIVTVGFNWSELTNEAARAYPDVSFIGVDQFQPEEIENVSGLIFPERDAGFLAGALAAIISETGTVAAVLGTDKIPPVVSFREGFEAGAYALNPEIEILIAHHPGEILKSFSDPEWGAETARDMLDQGADVIFGAGGLTGNGALIETASQSNTYCIGVDVDQWPILPDAQPCLVSSAMKQISNGVFELIARSMIGDIPAGNFNGDVKLAPFHAFEDLISAEANAILNELRDGLAAGEIPNDGTYIYPNPPTNSADQ